jgi:flagellar hook protein FlgE
MYSGVSGMKNLQVKMDVIANNIANVNTIGFKPQLKQQLDNQVDLVEQICNKLV